MSGTKKQGGLNLYLKSKAPRGTQTTVKVNTRKAKGQRQRNRSRRAKRAGRSSAPSVRQSLLNDMRAISHTKQAMRTRTRGVIQKASAKGLMSTIAMKETAASRMCPWKPSPCAVPMTVTQGRNPSVFSNLGTSANIDVRDLQLFIAAHEATGPEVFSTSEGISSLVWPAGPYPIVSINDPYILAILPMYRSVLSSYPRTWQAAFDFPGGAPAGGDISQASYSFPLRCRTFLADDTFGTAFPADFRVRPLARPREVELNSRREYVWVDANRNTAAVYSATFLLTFTTDTDFTAASLSVTPYCNHWVDGEPDVFVAGTKLVVGTPTVIGTHTYQWSGQASGKIEFAGWKYFTMALAFTSLPLTGSVLSITCTGTMSIAEHCSVGTAFLVDSNFAMYSGVVSRTWMGGHGILVSNRSPALTTQGSIYGVNYSKAYSSWQAVTSVGLSTALAVVDTTDKYNGTEGGSLLNGVYTWARPMVMPRTLAPTTAEYVSSLVDAPIGHAIDVSNGWDGNSVIFIDPSTSTSDHVVMRLTAYTSVAGVMRARIINAASTPFSLLPDQDAELSSVLSQVPNWSENDWHSFFLRAADIAGKVASYVTRFAAVASGTASIAQGLLGAADIASTVFREISGSTRAPMRGG